MTWSSVTDSDLNAWNQLSTITNDNNAYDFTNKVSNQFPIKVADVMPAWVIDRAKRP